MGRKEQRGGSSDEEEGATRRVKIEKKILKNDMWLEDASLIPAVLFLY